jgi:hypothetical protein
MSLEPPPINNPIMQSEDGRATIPWAQFFDQSWRGDAGKAWNPVFTNLTQVGAATITGRYYKLSQYLVFFKVTITPATSVSSTAGTTYCDFPVTMQGNGACLSVGNLLGGGSGMCDASSNRIYIPALSAVNYPVTIVGMVEAR